MARNNTNIDRFFSECEIYLKEGHERSNTQNQVVKSERPNQLWEIGLIGTIKMVETHIYFYGYGLFHQMNRNEGFIRQESKNNPKSNNVRNNK